ncbi:hypothetical protein HMPREF9248_0546 [Fannyhessea vaginae PB189-T1-4]|uniref:Lipoprotein n=1 Tax=Fannyhessea vaginae PB189-T1-4 TaxID=866774 RepID=A0ABN0AZ70_9ACTN|nr:hypothetical protein HMPREF9248_0546 [Fannyhessea vaginae PB189-T1-4]
MSSRQIQNFEKNGRCAQLVVACAQLVVACNYNPTTRATV